MDYEYSKYDENDAIAMVDADDDDRKGYACTYTTVDIRIIPSIGRVYEYVIGDVEWVTTVGADWGDG